MGRSTLGKQLTEKALRERPETRSNDRKLIYLVWWLQDKNFASDFANFFLNKAISPETIRRYRQKLQEQGKYRATETVEEARYNKYVDNKFTAGEAITEE